MTSLSVVEAFDLVSHAAQLADRLEAAKAQLAQRNALRREKEWLDSALELISSAKAERGELTQRALRLEELAFLREEEADERRGAWIDALEKLVAGITFHAGSRAPILEALFPKQKIASLRRAPKELAEKYHRDFEKRLNGGYVKRLLATDEFAFAAPVIEQVRSAYGQWEQAYAPTPLSEDEAAAIKSDLAQAAQKLEVPLRQAKLVAEAALAPINGAFEASGLAIKLKKRSAAKATVAAAAEAPPVEPTVEDSEAPAAEPAAAAAPAPKAKTRKTKVEGQPVVAKSSDEAPKPRKTTKPATRPPSNVPSA